jgi:hypothetical protein
MYDKVRKVCVNGYDKNIARTDSPLRREIQEIIARKRQGSTTQVVHTRQPFIRYVRIRNTYRLNMGACLSISGNTISTILLPCRYT